MPEFYRQLNDLINNAQRLVVATVIESHGSTPRDSGAKMILAENCNKQPTLYYSVGGGPLEAMVIEDAKFVFASGKPLVRDYQLNPSDTLGLSMTCGGSVKIFLEPIFPPKRLFLFGAGTVGLAVIDKSKGLGFSLTVIDDRIERLKMVPSSTATILTDESYRESFPDVKDSYVVIVTRCHPIDKKVLANVINCGTEYLGMIGSKRKVNEICKELEKEQGISPKAWSGLHAPIGLPVGGNSPEEIAISIWAEILKVRTDKTKEFASSQQH